MTNQNDELTLDVGLVPRNDEQVGRLLTERPRGWEYALLAGSILIGIEQLETEYSDFMLGYSPRSGEIIYPANFKHYIDSQFGDMREMIDALDALFKANFVEDAVGAPGVAGNPETVVHAASRIVRLYQDMLAWAKRIRAIAVPDEYRKVSKALAMVLEPTIEEMRNFALRFAAQVDKLPDFLARKDPFLLNETLAITVADDWSAKYLAAYKDLMTILP